MNLDVEVAASGWGQSESRKLEEYMEMVEREPSDDDDDSVDEVHSEESTSGSEEEQRGEDEAELTKEDDASETRETDDEVSPEVEVRRKKKVPELTQDQLTAMVASKLERTRLSNQRKHHSKKSVKSVGKQKGSKVKNDQKMLTSLDF